MRNEFLSRPLGVLIARHASPAVASMLVMACYQIVDRIMVGRSLGPAAMASVNILYPLVAFFSGLAVMIGVGGNARIAVLLGAENSRDAGRVLGLITALGIGLGVGATLLGFLLMPRILTFLGTSGELGGFAGEYLRGIVPFFVFMIRPGPRCFWCTSFERPLVAHPACYWGDRNGPSRRCARSWSTARPSSSTAFRQALQPFSSTGRFSRMSERLG